MQTERNGRIEKTMRQQLREILFEIELIKRKQVQEFLLGSSDARAGAGADPRICGYTPRCYPEGDRRCMHA